MKQLHITLNPAGVAAPAQRAALTAAQVVAVAINAATDEHLAEPWMDGPGTNYRFTDPTTSIEERRITYESWLLGKGFQDITRGIREMLEEAYIYIKASNWQPENITHDAANQYFASVRKRAEKLNLPSLLEEVDNGLGEPLAYKSELISMQRARNCLEHRRGIVSEDDADPGKSVMTLRFPCIKSFYLRGEQEIEIAPGIVVDNGTTESEVIIYTKLTNKSCSYDIGERIILTGLEFNEMAMACYLFAGDIVAKLPGN